MGKNFNNIIIVGPCGVGKSSISLKLNKKIKFEYLNFDALGEEDAEKRKWLNSPFMPTRLNLKNCLPIVINSPTMKFVLDLGGDNVFRKNVNNMDRLSQIEWVKISYNAIVVVLYANQKILAERFLSAKARIVEEFEIIWNNWVEIEEPNWRKCGDLFIDTSHLSIDEIITQIENKIINYN